MIIFYQSMKSFGEYKMLFIKANAQKHLIFLGAATTGWLRGHRKMAANQSGIGSLAVKRDDQDTLLRKRVATSGFSLALSFRSAVEQM